MSTTRKRHYIIKCLIPRVMTNEKTYNLLTPDTGRTNYERAINSWAQILAFYKIDQKKQVAANEEEHKRDQQPVEMEVDDSYEDISLHPDFMNDSEVDIRVVQVSQHKRMYVFPKGFRKKVHHIEIVQKEPTIREYIFSSKDIEHISTMIKYYKRKYNGTRTDFLRSVKTDMIRKSKNITTDEELWKQSVDRLDLEGFDDGSFTPNQVDALLLQFNINREDIRKKRTYTKNPNKSSVILRQYNAKRKEFGQKTNSTFLRSHFWITVRERIKKEHRTLERTVNLMDKIISIINNEQALRNFNSYDYYLSLLPDEIRQLYN